MKNERGFTLIEMLIVLMIISVLLLLIIPNMNDHKSYLNELGCDALLSVVQAQADAYYLETNDLVDDIEVLVDADYIREEQTACGDMGIVMTNGKASWE